MFLGRIYDNQGISLGVSFQQGGYPPLGFRFQDGAFLVIARSDERVFIPKGGCSFNRDNPNRACSDHPRQQVRSIIVCYLLAFFSLMF